MTQDRAKIIEKVSKLLNMANDKRANEQEALVAAEKATKLMEEYNINMTEVGLKKAEASGMVARSCIYYNNWRLGDHELAQPISRLCDCKYWRITNTNNFEFFGLKHDAEYAMFLYEMLSNTILIELEAYKAGPKFAESAKYENKITLYRSFIRAMQLRLAERLYEMALIKEDNVRKAHSTGTSLIVLKNQVVDQAFKESGMKIKSDNKKLREAKSEDAYAEGLAGGDRVNITTGINGSTQDKEGISNVKRISKNG